MTRSAELLAPAGSMESLDAAIRFGADAVYLGGPSMQLRAGQTAFSLADIQTAAQKLHAAGKRLFVAANAFTYSNEIPFMQDYARRLLDAGADAMIVSDIGAIRAVKRACPSMEVHVSTQANCLNHESCLVYRDLGAKRVVLGRELSVDQIREIRAKIPDDLELEAFVHGAMCMAYSGRCLLSTYLTGRSANRGGCAQSCRWNFALTEEKRPGQYFPIEEDENGTTILSSYDLNAMPLLDRILDAGVTSLKIEGRMKTAYYVATVVNAYRMCLSGAPLDECLSELDAASHRPYSTGFYEGEIKNAPNAPAYYFKTREYLGYVLSVTDGRAEIEVKNKVADGREVEILSPGHILRFRAGDLRDPDGNSIPAAVIPNARFTMPVPDGVAPGDYLRAPMEEESRER